MNDTDATVEENVQREQIDILLTNTAVTNPFNVATALVLTYVFWDSVPQIVLVTWISIMSLVFSYRYIVYFLWQRSSKSIDTASQFKKPAIFGILLMGFTWGVGGSIIENYLDVIQQSLLLVVLAGLLAGGLSSMSSVKNAFYAYFSPIISITFLWNVWQHDQIHLGMAFLIVFYGTVILLVFRHNHRYLKEAIHYRLENELLVDKLTVTNQALKEANKNLLHISLTDELTQLGNRHFFERSFDQIQHNSRRNLKSISLGNVPKVLWPIKCSRSSPQRHTSRPSCHILLQSSYIV